MKNGKINSGLVLIIGLVIVLVLYVMSVVGNNSINPLVLENVEALTLIETPDGKIIIEDEIPCASSANEIMIHLSYVNCSTCEEESGQAKGLEGKCTKIRIIDPNNLK